LFETTITSDEKEKKVKRERTGSGKVLDRCGEKDLFHLEDETPFKKGGLAACERDTKEPANGS